MKAKAAEKKTKNPEAGVVNKAHEFTNCRFLDAGKHMCIHNRKKMKKEAKLMPHLKLCMGDF